jgi:AraC-like DNA-binding protein
MSANSAMSVAGWRVLKAWERPIADALDRARSEQGQGLGLWQVPAGEPWAPWLLGISARISARTGDHPDARTSAHISPCAADSLTGLTLARSAASGVGRVEQQVPAHALCLLTVAWQPLTTDAPLSLEPEGAHPPCSVWASGPATVGRSWPVDPMACSITFLLQARVLPALTGQPAKAFRDQTLAEERLWQLLTVLAQGWPTGPGQALHAREAAEGQAARLLKEAPQAVALCRELAAAESVRAAASALHWTPRAVQRFCDRHFGLTPEQMRRLFRLHQGARSLVDSAGPARPGAELAAEVGYFDQSHMARDFRLLLRVAPTQAREQHAALLAAGALLARRLLQQDAG